MKKYRSILFFLLVIAGVKSWAAGAVSQADDRAARQATAMHRGVAEWVKCDGVSDDTGGLTRAFAAASHGTFTLVIDCPIRLRIGSDFERTIFIDDGTTVEFTGAGRLVVDNVLIPAFVVADASDIKLINWNVLYEAALPVAHSSNPGGSFNDRRLAPWLAANRRIVFDQSRGHVSSFWPGPTNVCAVFYITGDSARIEVAGMRVAVPSNAGVERYVPVVFSFNPNIRSGQAVAATTPYTAAAFALPHDLAFSDISLDGTYMGFVGSLSRSRFDRITSTRYGDLEDEHGGNHGGVGKWFAPPHLFYFSYSPNVDPALFNRDVQIRHVVDNGVRVGAARDLGGSDPGSGNALSLKIGCDDCIVDNYMTRRPDGFLDVLSSSGLTISNVEATYDSAFLNNLYPGWRFPKPPYRNVRFENIVLRDASPVTAHLPIENAADRNNRGLRFKNVRVEINAWAGAASTPVPDIAGQDSDSAIEIVVKANGAHFTTSPH